MTDDQRAAIERLRNDAYEKSDDGDYTDAGWTQRGLDESRVAQLYLAEHHADGLSAADELCEARRLLKLCRPVLIYRDQRELNAFLDRTSRFEK